MGLPAQLATRKNGKLLALRFVIYKIFFVISEHHKWLYTSYRQRQRQSNFILKKLLKDACQTPSHT